MHCQRKKRAFRTTSSLWHLFDVSRRASDGEGQAETGRGNNLTRVGKGGHHWCTATSSYIYAIICGIANEYKKVTI